MKYNINTAKKEVHNMITQYFSKDENGVYLVDKWNEMPVYIIGPAGVGKTQIIYEIAKELDLGFVSYSLVHHTRQTLMGLPVISSVEMGENIINNTEYTLSEVIGEVHIQI